MDTKEEKWVYIVDHYNRETKECSIEAIFSNQEAAQAYIEDQSHPEFYQLWSEVVRDTY